MPEKIIKWGIALLAGLLVPCIILMKVDIMIPLYIAQTKIFTESTLQISGL